MVTHTSIPKTKRSVPKALLRIRLRCRAVIRDLAKRRDLLLNNLRGLRTMQPQVRRLSFNFAQDSHSVRASAGISSQLRRSRRQPARACRRGSPVDGAFAPAPAPTRSIVEGDTGRRALAAELADPDRSVGRAPDTDLAVGDNLVERPPWRSVDRDRQAATVDRVIAPREVSNWPPAQDTASGLTWSSKARSCAARARGFASLCRTSP